MLWDYLCSFYKFIRSLNFNSKINPQGSWAVVTGSTDGIGQGFTFVLANQGFNIVQIARNPEKLAKNAEDLKAKYGIEVKNIVKDFSKSVVDSEKFFKEILDSCEGLDISLVVNNVGTSYSNTLFHLVPQSKLEEVLALNIFPTVFLTSMFTMKMSKRQGGGGFINLSSVLGNVKYERYSGYCAVKAFVKTFSELSHLDNQLIGLKNIKTLCLQPGYVLTPLTSGTKGKFLVIDRLVCAYHAIRLLGHEIVSHGYWKHSISGLIYRLSSYKTFMLIKRLNS